MKTKKLTLLPILFLVVIISSCEKESDNSSDREYLSNGQIRFKASGEALGYAYNLDDSYSLFYDYNQSRLDESESGIKFINVQRYSPDLLSYVAVQLTIDSLDNYVDYWTNGVFFYFKIVNNDNTVMTIGDVPVMAGCYLPYCPEEQEPPFYRFSNLEYDHDSKRLKVDFSYSLENGFEMNGNLDVQLFSLLNK